jgi:hypothetical protein
MSAEPYRDVYGEALAPARAPREADQRPGASTFDRLVESTLAIVESNAALTKNVGRLVRVTYAILLFNVALVAIVIRILAGH